MVEDLLSALEHKRRNRTEWSLTSNRRALHPRRKYRNLAISGGCAARGESRAGCLPTCRCWRIRWYQGGRSPPKFNLLTLRRFETMVENLRVCGRPGGLQAGVCPPERRAGPAENDYTTARPPIEPNTNPSMICCGKAGSAVQVAKEPIGKKGARSPAISPFRGRYWCICRPSNMWEYPQIGSERRGESD